MSRRGLGWVVLGVVLAVQAVVLVVVFDPTPHNGGDNAGYLALAHSLVDRGAYLELWDPGEPPHTKYPPGFPVILAVMMALGRRETNEASVATSESPASGSPAISVTILLSSPRARSTKFWNDVAVNA